MIKKLIIFALITVVCHAVCATGTKPDLSIDDASFTIYMDSGKEIEKLINLHKVTESKQITIEDTLQKTSEKIKRLIEEVSELNTKVSKLSEKLDKHEKLGNQQTQRITEENKRLDGEVSELSKKISKLSKKLSNQYEPIYQVSSIPVIQQQQPPIYHIQQQPYG